MQGCGHCFLGLLVLPTIVLLLAVTAAVVVTVATNSPSNKFWR